MRSAVKQIVVWGLVIFSVTAFAADKPTEKIPPDIQLAVITLPSKEVKPDEQARTQDALLDQTLAYSGSDLAWQLIAFSPPRYSPPEQGILGDLKKNIELGKQAYRYLKLPEALTTFKKTFQKLRTDPPAKCDPKTVTDLLFYWARASLDSGDEASAQNVLGKILRFDPQAGPDPAVMPPNVVAAFDMATEYQRHKPQAAVSIEVGPGRGALFVDCAAKPAGLVDTSSVVGEEFWIASEIEHGTFRASFTFRDGPKRHLTVWSGQPNDPATIAEHFRVLSRTPMRLSELTSSNVNLDAIASILNVQLLLLGESRISPRGKTVDVALYVPRKGVQGNPIEVSLNENGEPKTDSLDNAFNQLSNDVNSPTLLAMLSPTTKSSAAKAAEDVTKRKDSEESTPWYKTWWFWTAAGAVVTAAVVTGVVVGIKSSEETASGKVIIGILKP
jgi:hypothetical protein